MAAGAGELWLSDTAEEVVAAAAADDDEVAGGADAGDELEDALEGAISAGAEATEVEAMAVVVAAAVLLAAGVVIAIAADSLVVEAAIAGPAVMVVPMVPAAGGGAPAPAPIPTFGSAPGIGDPPPIPSTITPGPITTTPPWLCPIAPPGGGLGIAGAAGIGGFGLMTATPLAPAVTMVCSVDMGSIGMAGILPKGKPAIGQRQAHWHWPLESREPLPMTTLPGAAARVPTAAGGVVTVRIGGRAVLPIMAAMAMPPIALAVGVSL